MALPTQRRMDVEVELALRVPVGELAKVHFVEHHTCTRCNYDASTAIFRHVTIQQYSTTHNRLEQKSQRSNGIICDRAMRQ